MPDDAPRTRIFVTQNVLITGIREVDAVIEGDVAMWKIVGVPYRLPGEGIAWHRQRWAARNFARQLQSARLRELREEIDRVERLDFGLKR